MHRPNEGRAKKAKGTDRGRKGTEVITAIQAFIGDNE